MVSVDKIDGKRIVVKATDETDLSQSAVDIYNLIKISKIKSKYVHKSKATSKSGRSD